jgi:phenylacetate-coenzyme A ligase PaaK-like adenylate-forming protein
VIGCTCGRGTLHVNEDLVYVELLDDEGRPVTEPGARARRMLVTNLYNRVQPLIRYELNDLIELGEQCACGSGFRTIRRVLGRSDDVLWFATPAGGRQYVFPDLMSRWIISASDDVVEYRVEQADSDDLTVWMDVTAPERRAATESAVLIALEAELRRYGCTVPTIRFSGGVPPLQPGAKRKRFARVGEQGSGSQAGERDDR